MATIADYLADAKDAQHKLLTGQQVASFRDSNGEQVTYTPATAAKLADYIQSLEDQLNPGRRVCGPMRCIF